MIVSLLLYDSVTVTQQFSHSFSTKCITYYMNCIGAVTQSNPMGTNTVHIFVEKP